MALCDGTAGRRIGNYEVIDQIGQGGMGAVYLARRADDEFDSLVAIKMVWPGFDRSVVIERFRQERQILAQLNHPNIARLLDGGATEDGWPYLVMEYIDGEPITRYCNRHRLTIAERLRLFAQVCEAVSFAHSQSVVHRDLKPGNILVEGAPARCRVKLLDFGIARILDRKMYPNTASLTQTGLLAMTPEYASPEQVRGEPVGKASDIYSLGVLLYELLTGVSPLHHWGLNSQPWHEVIHTICNQEPLRPSLVWKRKVGSALLPTVAVTDCLSRKKPVFGSPFAGDDIPREAGPEPAEFNRLFVSRDEETPERLSCSLRGDLDSIVMKSIRKEPESRYHSVEELREEIDLYFAGQPVRARHGTLGYGARKFTRRHKGLFISVVTLILALIIGLILALRQAESDRQQARELRRVTYPERMIRAQGSLRIADIEQVKSILAGVTAGGRSEIEDLRGFEWYYLWRAINRHTVELNDDYPPLCALFNADGSRFLTVVCTSTSAGADGRVMYSGCALRLHATDGTQILSQRLERPLQKISHQVSEAHGDIVVWLEDAASSRHLEITPDGRLTEKCRIEDGTRLVAVVPRSTMTVRGDPSGSLMIHDCASHGLTAKLPSIGELAVDAIFTGEHLLVVRGQSGTIALLDWQAGKILARTKHAAETSAYDVDSQSRWLVTMTVDGMVFIRDLKSLRMITELKVSGAIPRAFRVINLPSGSEARVLVGLESGEVGSFSLPDLRPIARVNAHSDWVNIIDPSPDRQWLATGGSDHLVSIREMATGRLLSTLRGHRDAVIGAGWSVDTRMLVTFGEGGSTRLWSREVLEEAEKIECGQGDLYAVAFSSDSQRLVTAGRDGTARIWDAHDGRQLAVTGGHLGRVLDAAFSPDGRMVATSGEDQTVRLHDARTGNLYQTIDGHARQIHGLAFSPDGRMIATASDDHSVALWSPETGREIRRLHGHDREVLTVAFSPDSRLLATGSADQSIIIWDAGTGCPIDRLEGHRHWVWSVKFSPDGRRLASGSRDRTVIVWDLASRSHLQTLKGHRDEIFSIDFLNDGRRLATASNDNTVRLWDPNSGAVTLSFDDHSRQVWSVAFSPDGRMLASAGWDGTVRLYRADSKR